MAPNDTAEKGYSVDQIMKVNIPSPLAIPVPLSLSRSSSLLLYLRLHPLPFLSSPPSLASPRSLFHRHQLIIGHNVLRPSHRRRRSRSPLHGRTQKDSRKPARIDFIVIILPRNQTS